MTSNLSTVIRTMEEFASNTGLLSSAQPRRYLWTDAFAVCNYLGLQKRTHDEKYGRLALDLVKSVHNVLGRHRPDDQRKGWISGLSEDEGKLHPTTGGLRIGKKMQERSPSDPFDEDLEWDRDGQYYHYLTKWMHALNCVSKSTGDMQYNVFASELAQGVHSRFTYGIGSGRKRMYWKMSIDLSRALVPSMGHHDPLDGYITYLQINQSLPRENKTNMNLEHQIREMKEICQGQDWTTTDPLGLGGLLCDVYRVLSMMIEDESIKKEQDLLISLLQASDKGLQSYVNNRHSNQLRKPAEYRLAFRELGLSIGLQAVKHINKKIQNHADLVKLSSKYLDKLLKYMYIVEEINGFWSDSANQKARSWTGHLDINMVMWATSLMPDRFLCL
ncbi:uncharacterized protein LOC116303817 [Actinia tenebrosa]|uniref:Uncharacterized protein LOC116303817 n=1 Tax=Actinia tenebrosa TaxID=6105 RepID=A0A6P8IQD3_ACTTE|nr:uncharacterized protein LOC116303817 [Actinia tenebrosa]